MNVGTLCSRSVVTIDPNCSILEAANLMRRYHVGDVIAIELRNGTDVPIGILTDRDIVIDVLANDLAPEDVTVGDVMGQNILLAKEIDGIPETLEEMRGRGYRRVPVVNNEGALVGILAVDDILELMSEQMSSIVGLILKEQSQEERLHH